MPDANGVIRLGGKHARGASGWDEAVIANAPSGTGIFFPHWQGKGSNVEGVLHLPGVVVGTTVSVPCTWCPSLRPPTPPGPRIATVIVEEVIDPNWSIATFRLD